MTTKGRKTFKPQRIVSDLILQHHKDFTWSFVFGKELLIMVRVKISAFVFGQWRHHLCGISRSNICGHRRTHLPVDQAHDRCLDPHSHSEAGVHVLVVEERLEAGEQEHERGVEVAFPQRSVLVSHESQEKTEKRERCSSLIHGCQFLYSYDVLNGDLDMGRGN